jgi:hypothetical protein
MLTILERRTDVTIIDAGLIQITLYEGSSLSKQLMREVRAGFRAKVGKPIRGCVVLNHTGVKNTGYPCEICKKTSRLHEDFAIAVVCPNHCWLDTGMMTGETGPRASFDSDANAIGWLNAAL